MPSPRPHAVVASAGQDGSADVFLAIVGRKQGPIKGECRASGHEDEIAARTWQWGMSAPSAIGSTAATRRRVHEELVVTKRLDAASTRLMNALATNEELKSVKLSLRKAGAGTDDFFTIELEAGRVSDLHVESDDGGGLVEIVKFAFQKIAVTYHPQLAGGGVGPSQVFQDELVAP